MDINDIVLEKTKDNNWTCKINNQGKWKYMYSKYNPIKEIQHISPSSNYIILGLGLGYELNQIMEKTNGNIFVIDKDKLFYELALELNLLDNILKNKRVKFLFGDEYRKINVEPHSNFQLYNNENITQFSLDYFYGAIKYFSKSNKHRREKIAFYEHVTIAEDCIDALKTLGYEVVRMPFSSKDKMMQEIINENPDYIFSINLSEKIAEISRVLAIPYISWTVDTPAYSLYDGLLEYGNVIAFIYDENAAKELNQKGLKNVFYMPVAANVRRLDGVLVDSSDIIKYSCDASFLGSADISNEFNRNLFNLLDKEMIVEVEKIFNIQRASTKEYIIGNLIKQNFIERFEKQTGYKMIAQNLIDRKSKLAFLLGRKFNEIQRVTMVQELSQQFDFHVYGDESWKELKYYDIQYKGYAEHFQVMPKVFKCSKINVNNIRVYVEAGLPMRVFDVLGSQGFLATNFKQDIGKYFVDGKDLVVYRDNKDLAEIIKYYLEHEKDRKEISLNGYEKVKNEHTYEIRLKKIIETMKRYFNIE